MKFLQNVFVWLALLAPAVSWAALDESVGSISTAAATTIVTGTLGHAAASGSIVVIGIAQGGNGTGAATLSGFSTIAGLSVLSLPTSAASHFTALYKVAGGSEPTSYTVTLNSSNFAATTVWVFTGRNTSTPFTAESGTTAGATAATPLSIALTGVTAATSDDILWIAALSNSQGNGYPGPTFTPPSGFSSALTETSTTSFTVGAVGAVKANVSSGATGTITGTMAYTGGGSNSWGGYVISIAAAGASCTNNFWAASGNFAVPNGSSGSYWAMSGAFATPNCSSGTYWLKTGATGAT